MPPGAVKDGAKKLVAAVPRYRRRTESPPGVERQALQLSLYAQSLLATYRPSIASGIALHALHAAMGDEPKTHEEIKEYLEYMKSKEASLWIATFQDVTKYMRERAHGEVRSYRDDDALSVVLRDDLTDLSYDLPLTLKTYVPIDWRVVEVSQGKRTTRAEVIHDQDRGYVLYQAVPNAEVIRLTPAQQ